MRPQDIDYLYELYTSEEIGFRWVLRGSTPDPNTLRERLFAGVLAEFIIESRRSGQPIGLVSAYNANHSSGYAHLAMVVERSHQGSGEAAEAAALFTNYLFAVWPFRVVYAEGIEFNFRQFGSAIGRFFTEVARIPQREYYDGIYWDWVYGQLTRARWDELTEGGVLPFVRVHAPARVGRSPQPPAGGSAPGDVDET